MNMKKNQIIICFLMFLGVQAFAQEKKLDNIGNPNTNQSEFKFDETEYNFGTIKQGDVVTHEFKFTNLGSEPLIISKAEGSCGCTVPEFPKEPIMKNQSSVIKVTFNSTGKFGIQDKTVTLTSNALQNPMVIHIKGTVEKPAEQPATDKPKN
jgi:hypothetical protein